MPVPINRLPVEDSRLVFLLSVRRLVLTRRSMFQHRFIEIFVAGNVHRFGIGHQMIIIGILRKKLLVVERFVMFHLRQLSNAHPRRREREREAC